MINGGLESMSRFDSPAQRLEKRIIQFGDCPALAANQVMMRNGRHQFVPTQAIAQIGFRKNAMIT
jgi:hypothetical protein